MTDCLTEWLTDCRTDWLTDCLLSDWLIAWLIAWLTDCLTDWLPDWLTDCLIEWLIAWPSDWLTFWLIAWQNDWLFFWLADFLTDWLPDWMTDWLPDWMTDWLPDWLTDRLWCSLYFFVQSLVFYNPICCCTNCAVGRLSTANKHTTLFLNFMKHTGLLGHVGISLVFLLGRFLFQIFTTVFFVHLLHPFYVHSVIVL